MSSGKCSCGSNCSCGSGCNCNSCGVETSTTATIIVAGVAPKMTYLLRELRPALLPKVEMDASVDQAAAAIHATVKHRIYLDPNKNLCLN
ncbi:hypothetical protein Lser_V15G26632 [Lactuca serriola]